ncbi:MAG: amino acid ABC transporter permease [Clostridium sp.]
MASPFEFSYVFTVIGKIWEAMPVTLLLTFAPLFIGFLFGVPFAVIRRFNVPFAASFLKNASNILKGIPAVLLVLMINYLILKPIDYLALSYEWAKPLQTMNKIYIGIAALSIYAVVQITETVLGAFLSVGKGQYEAAYSIGLTRTKTLFRVVFPQAVPAALPVLCNNVIGLLKSTSIVYLISVNDILGAAINSAAVNFRYLEAYIAVAVVYWAMCVCVEKLFYVMEKRYKYAAGGKI